ncbi:MAG: tetratricopeptide repeat protein, partial [Planctomycetota bacterium]
EGLKAGEKAVALAPASAEGYVTRGNATVSLADAQMEAGRDPRGLYRNSVEDFTKALQLDPDSWVAYINRGYAHNMIAHFETGEGKNASALFREAIKDYEEAIRRSPPDVLKIYTCVTAYRDLGFSLEAFGEDPGDAYEAALRLCDRALALNPRYWPVLKEKAELFCLLARFEEGVKMFRRLVKVLKDPPAPLLSGIADTEEAAFGPGWMKTLFTAIVLKRRGVHAKSRKLFLEGLEAAAKTRATDEPKYASHLASFHFNYAGLLAQAMEGRKTCPGIQQPVTPEEVERWGNEAFQHLHKAVDYGWGDLTELRDDPEFAALRGHPSYKIFLAEATEKLKKK